MIIASPLFVDLPRKKKDRRIILNLNVYPFLHYMTRNDSKAMYNKVMADQLEGLILKTPIKLEFTLWRKDRRMGDRANVLAIVEKFFCDALIEHGCIEDDNDSVIIEQIYRTGGVDKRNPRVDIKIIENC